MSDRDWQATFTDTFDAPASAVQERVWRQVYGDEYPAGLDIYSYVTVSELDQVSDAVEVVPGDLLVDLACGRGGPGIWVAAHTGADLLGIDIAASAVAAAGDRAATAGIGDRARFQVGTFEATGLDDGSADAIMSIDALLFTPDKAAAVRELARVLRSGGRLVVTTWDYHAQPAGRPPQLDDHRPTLDAAGFEVLSYEPTVDWKVRMLALHHTLLDAADELAAESGDDPAEVREGLAEMDATVACMTRRVLFVAERR